IRHEHRKHVQQRIDPVIERRRAYQASLCVLVLSHEEECLMDSLAYTLRTRRFFILWFCRRNERGGVVIPVACFWKVHTVWLVVVCAERAKWSAGRLPGSLWKQLPVCVWKRWAGQAPGAPPRRGRWVGLLGSG